MPEPRVPAIAPHFFGDNRIGQPQESQALGCHLTEDPDGKAGPGERLAHDKFLVEPEFPADNAHFVLEQLAKRLHQLHPHPRRQPADIVMAFDHGRLTHDRDRLNHVRVQRPLRQEIDLAQLRRFRLEHVDERGADDFALRLRIDDASQTVEKQRRCIDKHDRQVQSLEPFTDLARFVQSQQAVVDENARQLVGNGAMENQRRDRRVDAAAQRADDAPAAHLAPNPCGCLVHEGRHRPVAGAAADAEGEIPQDLEAPFRVDHLRVEQNRVQAAARIRHRRDRRIRTGGDHCEPTRRRHDEIAMARPDPNLVRHVHKQGVLGHRNAFPRFAPVVARRRLAFPQDGHGCVAELALRRRRDPTAERIRHQLHAVTDAEHGDAQLVDARVAFRRSWFGDALRAAR